jgi:anthranilate 1,2-dioxygenase small subunit
VIDERTGMSERLALRLEVEEFYARYVDVLDNGPIDEWPTLFAEKCVYKVIARENFDADLPLGTMYYESRNMLKDRAYALKETLMYGPRSLRHFVSGMIISPEADGLRVRANFMVTQVQNDALPTVFSCGQYRDRLVRSGGQLLLAEKICVYDNDLIQNSMVWPL